MAVNPLKQEFRVSAVSYQLDTETRLNIKKRRERIVYRTLSHRDNINISYLIGNQVNPVNNLFISDKSTSLTQNRLSTTDTITIATAKTITSNVEQFLITDVFTDDTPTQEETPLFYKHQLTYYNDGLENFDNLTLLSFEFADHKLNPVVINEYSLDTSTGYLYNNIENVYDASDQSFTIRMVKYTVREVSGSTTTTSVYHELIDNTEVYEQATFDDLEETGMGGLTLKAGKKKYFIEQVPGLDSYLITLPSLQRYAYKEAAKSRIRVIEPTAVDLTAPWYIRITNGKFLSSQLLTGATYRTYKYYISEFNNQLFFPFPPYKQQIEQKATWLYDNLIYLPKQIAYDTALGLDIEILVKDKDRALKYIYTTNEDKVGTTYTGSTLYTNGISSVDQAGGFIEIADNLLDTDTIEVSYFAEEDQYEFTYVDLNPVNNLDMLNQRLVVYVNPENSTTGTLDNTLHYLLVDQAGKITYASQAVDGGIDPATQKLLSEDFLATGDPQHDFYYDAPSTASGLASRVSGINTSHINDFSFVDKYTVDSILLTTTVSSGYAPSLNFSENPRFLVLADIYVGENDAPSNLTKFDVRTQGGGIKEDNWRAALNQQAEAAWYWDYNSRRPYPAVGTFLAEVPQTLLTSHGGSFTLDQVNDVIERHMKVGGYAVVKTYGIDPTITNLTTTSGTITVGWPSYGSSITYDVYYSNTLKTGFTQSNSSSLTDDVSGNSFTVSGLKSSTKYFIKIGATDENDDQSFGPTVAGTTLTSVAS